jgi:hypothetical protein
MNNTPVSDLIIKQFRAGEAHSDGLILTIGHLELKLAAMTVQRDRLAEALEQLMSYQPRATVITTNERHVWSNAKDALQSLNQPTEP